MIGGLLRRAVFFMVAFFALVLYGCGSGGSLSPNPADEPSTVTVSVDSHYQTVDPDGKTRVPITVMVFKGNGDPANGVKVEVSTDPDVGTFDAYSKTTQNGKAVFYYTVPGYETVSTQEITDVTINVSVAGYDVAGSGTIYFNIYASKLVASVPDNSTILPADGSTVVPITVYAYRGDGAPLKDVVITASISPNIGSLDKMYETTDDGGVAVFNYTLPSREDALRASADHVVLTFRSADGASVTSAVIAFDNVKVGNGIPAAIMLSAQPSMIFTSGVGGSQKISQITARVVDSSGDPVKGGYTVRFTLLRAPNGTYITPSEVPVENGVALANVVAGAEPGTVLVQAQVVEKPSVVSSSAVVYVTTGEPSRITLTESGRVIPEDDNGTRSEGIYALVKDSNGNPVADGTVVYFTLSDSCGGVIQNESVTVNGIATAKLTYPGQCIWKSYRVYAETSGGQVTGVLSGVYPAVAPVQLVLSGPTAVSPYGGIITVVAQLKDENGEGLPIGDTSVLFSSSDNVTFDYNPVTTDSSGIASVNVYIPALPDNVTIREITITGQAGTATGTLQVLQQIAQ